MVPRWLAAMTDPATSAGALDDLDSAVYHQGGAVYSAAAAVVPLLIRFALDPAVPGRSNILAATAFARGDSPSRPHKGSDEVSTMMRILITGLAGAGKTTLAQRLSMTTGIPWHSLDDLYYGPGLVMASTFPASIEQITASDEWIFDSGGPPPTNSVSVRLRELMWSRADTLLWLDYSQPVVLYRATTRSLRRIVTRQRLWHGHRDTPAQWLREDHPIRRAWSTHRHRREEIAARLADPSRQALTVMRFNRPNEAEAFLQRTGKR